MVRALARSARGSARGTAWPHGLARPAVAAMRGSPRWARSASSRLDLTRFELVAL